MKLVKFAVVSTLTMGGCVTLSRTSPPIREYVLSSVPPEPTSGTWTVGLRRADVAAYLTGPAIIVRQGEHEVVASDFHRWREPVDEALNRVVASNLTGLSPVRAVEVAPWATRAHHNVWVQLHVARFEGVLPQGSADAFADLDATWDIIRPLDGRVLVSGRTTRRSGSLKVGDYRILVAALDSALTVLARDIASCLGRFRNDTTPPSRCGEGRGGGG